MDKKKLTPPEALQKLYRYCTYQERSHKQVREKLYSFGLWRDAVDEIITRLITEGFLNEQRFASSFAGGKFRMKKWGKVKITKALEAHSISANCIRAGLKEIDDDDYRATLQLLIEKKGEENAGEPDLFVKRDKIANYLIRKGFEPDLVWGMLREIVK